MPIFPEVLEPSGEVVRGGAELDDAVPMADIVG